MQKKNLLITGGAGFIGSNLAAFLKDKLDDYQIIVFDNLLRRGSEMNVSRLEDLGIKFIKGDVRDKEHLLKFSGIDMILECSAEPSVLAAFERPEYVIETNLTGTANCLELAKREKARFLFLSTSRVYPIEPINLIPFEDLPMRFDWPKGIEGLGYNYEGINEDFPLPGVRSLYGSTKLCSEHLILEFLNMFSMKGIVNRLGVVAGPWQMGKVDQGIVGFWLAQHIFGGKLNYIGYKGSGKQVRDAIHIDDVCDLILNQIQSFDKFSGKIFNVGGGRENSFSLKELTSLIQKIVKKKTTIDQIAEVRKADLRIYITDNSYVKKITGWKPKKNLENILNDTHEWISRNSSELEKVLIS